MRLARDIGFASLTLGVERVELEVEIVLARLAGIDRTALGFWSDRQFEFLHRMMASAMLKRMEAIEAAEVSSMAGSVSV
jgi:hypothetical protein